MAMNLRQKETLGKTAEKELARLEVRYAQVQDKIDLLELNRMDLKKEILAKMAVMFPDGQSAAWTNAATGGTLTRVPANRIKFNLPRLILRLPQSIFDRITKRVGDTTAYMAAVETGLVNDQELVNVGAVEHVTDIRLLHS